MKGFSIKTLYLVCSGVLSVCSLFGIRFYVNGKIDPQSVWTYTRDIKANTKISDSDIQLIQIPKNAVTSSFITTTDSNEIVGKYVTTDVYANEYVLEKHTGEITQLDPFKSMDTTRLRKISIPGNMVETAGPIKRGDKVDLIYYGKMNGGDDDNSEEVTYGKVFMQNIPVYEVITGSGVATTGPEDVPEGAAYNQFYEHIVLAVSIEDAEEILTRRNYGEVGLITRFDDSESYKTSGFAINKLPSPDKLPYIGKGQVERLETRIIDNDM